MGREEEGREEGNRLSPASKNRFRAVYRALYRRHGPQDWWPGDTPLEIMVGAILTQNTAWTNVEKAIANLKRLKLLNFSAFNRASTRTIREAIRPAGFFRVKTARLKIFIGHIRDRHAGSVSRFLGQPGGPLREELLSIKGIGPETADSILLYAANKPFFVVDAYTRRIFGRLGLLNHRLPYEDIRRTFETAVPADVRTYNEYHALIVRHAKETCHTRPKCGECVLESACQKRTAMAI